ncbi:uncharacterized protein C8R40DRAFT_1173636 [Lentinula edodes]|uniref:uncharacterized protein n=1 Tax=Lentinula edodes TaxID=5353 RepID=UPI001E8E5B62|nr:uncharacterized protein C8R40DRAFT_1173636 [Lentinula edodes]KAH7872548.1 hypothetical protein C8R40DRAFT_1173636 [Lentinula edodes]
MTQIQKNPPSSPFTTGSSESPQSRSQTQPYLPPIFEYPPPNLPPISEYLPSLASLKFHTSHWEYQYRHQYQSLMHIRKYGDQVNTSTSTPPNPPNLPFEPTEPTHSHIQRTYPMHKTHTSKFRIYPSIPLSLGSSVHRSKSQYTPHITHPTSHIPHPTSHIPHPTSHTSHHTSHIPHPTPHIAHCIALWWGGVRERGLDSGAVGWSGELVSILLVYSKLRNTIPSALLFLPHPPPHHSTLITQHTPSTSHSTSHSPNTPPPLRTQVTPDSNSGPTFHE